MPTFDSFSGGESGGPSSKGPVTFEKEQSNLLVAKVFGVMFIGLLLTALIAGGLGFYLGNLLITALDSGDVELADTVAGGMMIGLIVSAIGLLILSIVIPMTLAKAKHSIIVPLILYILFMGVMLSMFVMFIDWWILAEAALITGVSFGAISLIGLLGKGRIPGLALSIGGLFLGLIVLSIVSFITMLFGGNVDGLSLVISFIFLALLMFISINDVRNINNIASKGAANDNNLVLYCAFIIYSDVIAIFVRLVYLLSRLKRN